MDAGAATTTSSSSACAAVSIWPDPSTTRRSLLWSFLPARPLGHAHGSQGERCSGKHVTVSGRDNLRSSGAANEVRASVRLIVCGRSVELDPGELAGYYGAQTTVLRVAREAHLLPV
jgi:hypothetical protein